MATITSTGLGSGLDISSLVSQLVSAESTPATNRINTREAKLQTEFSAIGMFKNVLSDFRSSVFSLTLSSTFKSMKATVSDTSLFTASASNSSTAASYNIKVNRLAQAHSLELTNTVDKDDQLGIGTLKISVGDGTSHEVAIDSDNNTLEGIAKAINDTAGIGITATILNNGDNRQISLKSTATGAVNTIKIEVTDDDGNNTDGLGLSQLAYDPISPPGAPGVGENTLKQLQAAQDASITIDGSSTETTSTSNIFLFSSGSLSGVQLELKALTGTNSADTAKLEIGRNTSTAIDAVQAFVDGFNSLVSAVKTLTSYDSTTQQGGALLGDASVRSINFQLRKMLGESVGGSSAFNNLSSIGIETQRDGTLKFDSSKLQTALGTDQSGVAKLFTGAEASDGAAAIEGLGNRFKNYLDDILSSKGPLNNRLDTINKNIAGLADDRETLNMRLQKLETRYLKQFSAMDALVGQLSATSSFLTQQLEGMANLYKK
ncbi:MAG: flagellar filament capping protein FliD [Gammaproteobacteria bacterium]|nr:flagellar filament capping protein FliD [Gammaproteobacteria bacterium]